MNSAKKNISPNESDNTETDSSETAFSKNQAKESDDSKNAPNYESKALEKAHKVLRNMIGQDVTWTAIATLGGAAIVFWNTIKYIIILNSSYSLYRITRVPMYLLVMRKNTSFTDAYIFYLTVLALMICFSYTKYNVFPVISEKYLELMLLLMLLFVAFVPMTLYHFFPEYWFLIQEIVNFLFPLYLVIFLYFAGATQSPHSIYEENDDEIEDEEDEEDEEVEDSFYEAYVRRTKRLKLLSHILAIIFAITFILQSTSEDYYYLIDQQDRFIVADLGDRYIVQDAVYTSDERILHIDNSHYYNIDSSNETIRIIENASIKPLP